MSSENVLYLTPSDFSSAPSDPESLAEELKKLGFIGETLEFNGERHYAPGEEFLTLITFLGCSPVISMGEPGKTGEEFCHIAFDGPYPLPRFIGGDNLKTPRCPGCGHRFEQWQELVATWKNNGESNFRCPECDRELTLPRLRWRKSAGFGRYFIKIWGIFESEAIPNPNLLSALQKATGSAWLHFYIRNTG